jgi:hypothetical protein
MSLLREIEVLSARTSPALIQSNGAAIAVAPLVRKRITRAQLVAGREKEEGSAHAVGDVQFSQRLHHRLHPVMVGRDRQHPERLPSEMLLVLFPRMRGEIGAPDQLANALRPARLCRAAQPYSYWDVLVAVDVALSVGTRGGESVVGKDCVVGGAAASMNTVRVEVEVRPVLSVAT